MTATGLVNSQNFLRDVFRAFYFILVLVFMFLFMLVLRFIFVFVFMFRNIVITELK